MLKSFRIISVSSSRVLRVCISISPPLYYYIISFIWLLVVGRMRARVVHAAPCFLSCCVLSMHIRVMFVGCLMWCCLMVFILCV